MFNVRSSSGFGNIPQNVKAGNFMPPPPSGSWVNPRRGRGDRCDPLDFLRCMPNYGFGLDRAEILHSLWGILCATFGVKILTGSCQVMELWRHKRHKVRSFLQETAEYRTLEGDIDHDEASFHYFRSDLTCMTQPLYPLTFWSRLDQSQRQG